MICKIIIRDLETRAVHNKYIVATSAVTALKSQSGGESYKGETFGQNLKVLKNNLDHI